MSDKALDEALGRLADRFKYGHLTARANPAGFIDEVTERLEQAEALLELAMKMRNILAAQAGHPLVREFDSAYALLKDGTDDS